jgi:hypothetical protein
MISTVKHTEPTDPTLSHTDGTEDKKSRSKEQVDLPTAQS